MTMHHCRAVCTRAAFVLTALVLPAIVSAQAGSAVTTATTDSSVISGADNSVRVPSQASNTSLAGPRITSAIAVTVRHIEPFAPALPPNDGRAGVGRNLALVGVGAAALVAGLVVGGDGGHAVALGGSVIGLIGLYRYLR